MVIFYTSHCPKCRILSALMDKKGICYKIVDEENVYLAIAEKNGIFSMPFAEVNGLVITDSDLQEWIKKQEVKIIE